MLCAKVVGSAPGATHFCGAIAGKEVLIDATALDPLQQPSTSRRQQHNVSLRKTLMASRGLCRTAVVVMPQARPQCD